MDRNKTTTTKQKTDSKKKKDFPALGIKKKPLKAGKEAGGAEVKAKLEVMKKFSQVFAKSNEDIGNNEGSTENSRNKGINKYAQEVVKDTLQKRENEKFQLSNPKIRRPKGTEVTTQVLENKKVESPQLSEEQVEGLMRKFNQKANITIGERVSLANELGLTEKQVLTWFSSRRTKMKKTQELAELIAGSGQDTKQLGSNQNRLTMKKGRGPKTSRALPQTKLDVDVPKIADADKNHEIIDVIDDEDDREIKFDVVKDLPLLKSPLKSRPDKNVGINQVRSAPGFSDTKFKVEKSQENQKDKEIEVLKQEIKVILNDMVKKSVMEREVEAWKTKFESLTKEFKEKEQFVKDLEVKIPNMIGEYKKCVENKEYLFDLKEKELKKAEAAVTEKDNELEALKVHTSKLSHELEKTRKEKHFFAEKFADLDGMTGKVNSDMVKKDLEIKMLKEKSKEEGMKIKELLDKLKRNESIVQTSSIVEVNKLKQMVDSQVNTIQNLTKTCEYQKTQLSYLKNEVEARGEMLNKKEEEMRQIRDSLAQSQANVSQCISKNENQGKIIENQKTRISQFQLQNDIKSKDIEELQAKIKKINVKLIRKLDEKQVQVNNLKRSNENKNLDLERLRTAQDKLFSQLNDLELRNYNMVEKLKVKEREYESVLALERKNIKTVNIQDAAKEYIAIMKSNLNCNKKNKTRTEKAIKEITVEEQFNDETGISKHVDRQLKELNAETIDEKSSNILGPLKVNDDGAQGEKSQCVAGVIFEQEVSLEADSSNTDASIKEPDTEIIESHALSIEAGMSPDHEAYNKNQEEQPMDDGLTKDDEVRMEIEDSNAVLLEKRAFKEGVDEHVGIVDELERDVTDSEVIVTLSTAELVKSKTRKSKRKLLKRRPGVDMAIVSRNRSTLKRPSVTVSAIPSKRLKLSSDNISRCVIPTVLGSPRSLSFHPGSWERLVRMKHVLSIAGSQVSSIHSTTPVCSAASNWPIVPYTGVQKRRIAQITLLYPASFSSPLVPMAGSVKRQVEMDAEESGPKRLKLNDDSPSWPVVTYKCRYPLIPYKTVVTRKNTVVHGDDFSSRAVLVDSLPVLNVNKRTRDDEDEDKISTTPSKKLRSCSPSICWPVALYHPSHARLLPSFTLSLPVLPLLCTNYPVIKYRNFREDIERSVTVQLSSSQGHSSQVLNLSCDLVLYSTMSIHPRDRKDTMYKNQEVQNKDESYVSAHEVCQEVVARILERVFNCDMEDLGQGLIDEILEDIISCDNKELCQEIVGDILKSAFIPDQQEMCKEVVDAILNAAVAVDSEESYAQVVADDILDCATSGSQNVKNEYENEQVCEKILSDVIKCILHRL